LGHSIENRNCEPPWYAVSTRSRQEKVAAGTLSTFGIENYLPLQSEIRQWSDRQQRVEVPLFSGYLFVHVDVSTKGRLRVLQVPGVVSFVGNQTGPLPIPVHQIESLRMLLATGQSCSVQPIFKEGDRVRVVSGALTGIEGTLVRTNTESRLQISINTIGKSVAISVSPESVERIGQRSVRGIRVNQSSAA
jgi:transcription antitermination factor NusG